MKWRCLVASAASMLIGAAAADAAALRVCADPNNLPFSDQAGQGFENKIVGLIAQDLGSSVDYTWWAQRRGYVRHTLKADICDIWPGVAVADAEAGAGADSDFTYAARSHICIGPKTNCQDGMPFGRPCAMDS